MLLLNVLQKLRKSPINVKKNMEGGDRMKKRAIIVLCLALVLTLIGCGNNAQSSDAHNAEYEEGYAAGYEAGYNDGKQQIAESKKHFAQFSGSFTATVEQLLPITMRCREKRLQLFTSFRTDHFCFISRKT